MIDENNVATPDDSTQLPLTENTELIKALEIIGEHSDLLDEAKVAINEVLKDSNLRLKLFLVGVGRVKINTIIRMLKSMDALATKVLDPVYISSLTCGEAVQLLNTYHKMLTIDLEYISKVVNNQDTQDVLEKLFTESPTKGMERIMDVIPQESRERLRLAFNKLQELAIENK